MYLLYCQGAIIFPVSGEVRDMLSGVLAESNYLLSNLYSPTSQATLTPSHLRGWGAEGCPAHWQSRWWIAVLRCCSQSPLFFYLLSLEQTSHNKLHGHWILKMQGESVWKNNKGAQVVYCLIPPKGTMVPQTRSGTWGLGERAWYLSFSLMLTLFYWMLTQNL